MNFIDAIFLIAPLFYGVLPIWSCCLLGITSIIGILYKFNKEKKLIFPKGISIYLIGIYLLSFLVTEFVAIDKGMNLLALIKNIPILLFIFLLAQFKEDEKDKNRHLYIVSISATISVLISLLFAPVEKLNIYSNNRLHGLFYYANSYGLFLLIGALILLFKKDKKWYDFLMLAVLFIGIVLTNSRAIILMTIILSITSLFFNKECLKSSLIAIGCFLLIIVGAYFIFNMEKRVNPQMLESSEFISRIIYYEDALTMIKIHPFGLGYEGFWYEQAKEQTGIYDSKFVHSSLIQICLDVGIIPLILLSALFGITFFSKKQTAFSRLIMLAIIGHSLIDIDLEYLYFILIFALFIDYKTLEISSNKLVYSVFLPLLFVMGWIFIGDACFYAKDYEKASEIIPFHSDALQETLYSVTAESDQLAYANKVLKFNKNVSGAYEALRNDAIKNQKYDEAIKYEKERLLLNKYKISTYMNYAAILVDAIYYYQENNEVEKAYSYLNEIVDIETTINDVLAKTNPLCYKTIHTPELDIPEGLQKLIDESKELLEK